MFCIYVSILSKCMWGLITSREERRNASKLYHPMRLGDVGNIAPIVDWTSYVNNILTEDIGIQVSSFKFHFALYFINKQSIKQILIKMIGYYVFCILIDEILHTNKKLFDMVY